MVMAAGVLAVIVVAVASAIVMSRFIFERRLAAEIDQLLVRGGGTRTPAPSLLYFFGVAISTNWRKRPGSRGVCMKPGADHNAGSDSMDVDHEPTPYEEGSPLDDR